MKQQLIKVKQCFECPFHKRDKDTWKCWLEPFFVRGRGPAKGVPDECSLQWKMLLVKLEKAEGDNVDE
jgi:hypothetical protein